MDTTDPIPVAVAHSTPEEDQETRLARFKEHQHKVKVYRIHEEEDENLMKGDLVKQKSIKAPSKPTTAKRPTAPQPIIKKRFIKKTTPELPKEEQLSTHSVDTEKLLLGCVCIGLGLYLIYLTHKGSLVAKEIVSDT